MTNQEKMALLMSAYDAIFSSKMLGTDITQIRLTDPNLMMWNGQGWQASGVQHGRWFVNNTLRGFDMDINVGNNEVVQVRVLEQNPLKQSQYAVMARQGIRICWVIDRKVKENAFLGRIQDGQWHANEPRATYPATPGAVVYAPAPDVVPSPDGVISMENLPVINMETLPEIPDQEAIPEVVYNAFADDDGDDIPQDILDHITEE